VDCDRIVRDPLVSVVMITYNHEPYIAQAIEGVVSQETDFPIELVIGEDCSTDRTREIVLDYQRRYPEIIRVIYSEKNVGMHANSRRTILAARGGYIAFCEGDDWWHRKDKLQIQVRALDADSRLVWVSAQVRRISANGRILGPEKHSPPPQQPTRLEYEDLIFGSTSCPTCTVLARTDAVRQALLRDSLCSDYTQLMGDGPLWLELSQNGQMIRLNEALASYRQTPNSATRQRDPLHAWHFIISSLEVRYRSLERYPLPGDSGRTSRVKANFANQTLIFAAWMSSESNSSG
jgi:glycosyltransferase involved in cell wall biosynthesis